jgi:DNA-directed RNA polymerase specialized sigma24 family protein
MPEAKHIMSPTPYASSDDFCRIFSEETTALYRLSFLLTADPQKAEQCFASGLDDSVKGNPVFKEWARSWARRTIIQNAVRLINPRPIEEYARPNLNRSGESLRSEPAGVAGVLELAPFERFVFVMSVLERYSDQECSLLLSCSPRDVIAARSRALQQIVGSAMGSLERQLSVNSERPRSSDICRSDLAELLHV